MHSIIVDIVITPEEYLKQYQHSSAVVTTISQDGRRVNFPANILQPFVSHSGVKGCFKIRFNSQGKYLGIDKLSD
jgi:hypothetical protein